MVYSLSERYRRIAVRFIYIEIFYNIIIKFAIGTFNAPSLLNYGTDLILIIIVLFSLGKLKQLRVLQTHRSLFVILILMFVTALFGWCLNGINVFLVIWGLRNSYRFFVFGACCAANLEKHDVAKIIRYFEILLPVNVILCTYQYSTLRYSGDSYIRLYLGDFIGGIFGTIQGSNAVMNLYLCAVVSFAMVQYLSSKYSLIRFTALTMMCVYVSMLSELKVFFFELIILVLLAVMVHRPNRKTIAILVGICIAVPGIITVWSSFNENSASMLQWNNAFNYLMNEGYAGSSSLNRFSAIPIICTKIFHNDPLLTIFGIGFGNAEHSAFSIFESPFYQNYGQTLKYTYFSQAMIFLETGALGLILYILYFIAMFLISGNTRKFVCDSEYVSFSQIYAVCVIISIFYNSAMRIESTGYFSFLILSIPFIWEKAENNLDSRNANRNY